MNGLVLLSLHNRKFAVNHVACGVNSLVCARRTSPSILFITVYHEHCLYEFVIVVKVEIGDNAGLVKSGDQLIIDGVCVFVSIG